MPKSVQEIISKKYNKKQGEIEEIKIEKNDWNDLGSRHLPLSEFINLKKLYIQRSHSDSRKINSLDLTNNHKLQELKCGNNELTDLDLSNCSNLKELDCQGNQLNSIE